MADLFVSYAREDIEVARRLSQALADGGKDVWVDWEDIPALADWKHEIAEGIESSDAFAFVLSPDSLESEVCAHELKLALDTNTRIVPIVARDPEGEVPAALADRNWVFMRESDDFEAALQALVAALETDYDRVRTHTRLLQRANEWDRAGRGSSRLLRGDDLEAAEAWAVETSEPQPTELHRELIAASRRATTRRGRILLAAVSGGLVIALGLATFALVQRSAAIDREREASARGLVSAAQANLERDPELSVLLALESVRAKPSAQGDEMLRRAVAANPVRALLAGGPSLQVGARFGVGGRSLVGLNGDGTVRVFDLPSGRRRSSTRPVTVITDFDVDASGQLAAIGSVKDEVLLYDVFRGRTVRRLPGHGSQASSVSFAAGGRRLVTAGANGVVHVWAVPSGRQVARLDPLPPSRGRELRTKGLPAGSVAHFAVSDDASLIASVDNARRARLWDTRRDVARPVAPALEFRTQAAVSPDGDLAAFNPRRSPDVVVVTPNGTIARRLESPGTFGEVGAFAFADAGRRLAVGHFNGEVALWTPRAGQRVSLLVGHTATIGIDALPLVTPALGVSLLIAAAGDGTARAWDAHAGLPRARAAQADHSAVLDLDVDVGTRRLATGLVSGRIALYELLPGRRLWRSPDRGRALFARRGRWIVTGGRELVVRDARTHAVVTRVAVEGSAIAVDGAAERVAVTTADRMAIVDLRSREVVTLRDSGLGTGAGAPAEREAAFSADGRSLVGIAARTRVHVWDTASGRPVETLREPGARYVSVDVDQRGQRYAAGRSDGRVRIAPLPGRPGRPIVVRARDRGQFRDPLRQVRFSADGRLVSASTLEAGATVWDARTGLERSFVEVLSAERLAFGPGSRLAIVAGSGTTLADAHTGRVQAELVGHEARGAVFSADGRTVVTAGADGTARFWDARTGGELGMVGPVGSSLNGAALSADGRTLLVSPSGGHPEVYACDVCGSTAAVQRAARSILTRRLTPDERRRYGA